MILARFGTIWHGFGVFSQKTAGCFLVRQYCRRLPVGPKRAGKNTFFSAENAEGRGELPKTFVRRDSEGVGHRGMRGWRGVLRAFTRDDERLGELGWNPGGISSGKGRGQGLGHRGMRGWSGVSSAFTRDDERLADLEWNPGKFWTKFCAKLVRNFGEAGRLWLCGEAPAGSGGVGGSLCVWNSGREGQGLGAGDQRLVA